MNHFYKIFSTPNKVTNRLKNAAASFALLFASFSTFNAQVSTYIFGQSSGTYTPITGTVLATATGNTATTSLNSDIYPVTLPFNFIFNGVSYSSLNVSTNGFLSFGATAPGATVTSPISSTTTTAYDGAVSAFGRDLNSVFDVNGVTGNISWDVVGTAPNREIVIQWKDFRPTNVILTTSVYTFSFQVRLQETSNVVKTVYNSGSYVIGSTAYNSTAQIGLRGTSVADFNNRLNATTLAFVSSTAGTANSSTQAFHTVNATPGMPSAGLTYTWTPPSCYTPGGLVSNSTTTTTADISWNASSSAPTNGYDVYYSTSSTPPTSSTTPSQVATGTSATLSPLAASTLYYVWVRSNCGSGNTSIWSLRPITIVTQCQPPAILSSTGATVCPNQTATLSATGATGAILKWYDVASGGTSVGTGGTFVTPSLTATTDYWVTASNISGPTNVGATTPANLGASNSTNTSWDLLFTVYSNLTLNSVDVFPGAVGQAGTIEVLTASGTSVSSVSFTTTVSGTSTPQTVPLNIVLSPGTYAMRRSGAANLHRNSAGAVFPYSTPQLVITGTTFVDYPAYYFYFYNINFTSACESARTMVTATVDAGCLSTSENEKKDAVKVHPNPFSEIININKPELVKSIQLSDLSGKMVRNNVKVESVLRLNDLSQGVYILLLDMKDGSRQSIKIIKK